jgi:hypothetical protein
MMKNHCMARAMTALVGCAVAVALFTPTPAIADDTPTLLHQWTFDTEPGWAMEGEWEFGVPQGLGGDEFGNPDPTSGYTGDNVYGVNLQGDYSDEIGGPYCLSMGPIDMTGVSDSSLHFWRWLNTDWLPWVSAKIQVSNDNTNWVTLWENANVEITDDAWNHWELDMSAVADGQPTVWVRWTHEVFTGGTWAYSGWNIDDVELWGVTSSWAPGDLNCDGIVSAADIDPFVVALTNPGGYAGQYPGCDMMNGDINGDDAVTAADIDPFVALLTGQ